MNTLPGPTILTVVSTNLMMLHAKIVRFIFTAAVCIPTIVASDFQGATHLIPLDEDTVGYSKAEPDSAISRLQKMIDSGTVVFEWDEKFGYLPSLLKSLGIPASSQMLVFSKNFPPA